MSREMKDSGVAWIGEMPSEWRIYTVGSLFNVRNEKVNDTDYPPLSVTRGGVVPQMENVAKSDANDNRKQVLKNDFVINSRSDRKQSCGVSSLDGSVSLINTVLFTKNNTRMLSGYPNYLMKNYGFAEEFYRWGHGIVADLWTTRWQEMKNICLPVPSVEEQERILDEMVRRTQKIDKLIDNQQRQTEKLKQYKQSIITEVVNKGLNKDSDMMDCNIGFIGKIPCHWTVCKFGKIATVKSNLVSPENYLDYYQISPENIEKGSGKMISYSTVRDVGVVSNNHLFYEGQIIYSKVRPLLNKVMIAPFDGLCSADMYPIESSENAKYVLYLMLSEIFLAQVKLTTENRVKMPKINQQELSQILVCIPPKDEQVEMVKYLDEKCSKIDSLIAIKQQKIDKLNQYKKSIIYEYVTGKKEA